MRLPKINDDNDTTIVKAVAVALAAFLAIALLCFIFNDSEPQQQDGTAMDHVLVLDYNNAYLMHAYGLPTAEDVMYYHMHGQWGYYDTGVQKTFDQLPGRADRWDALYGIEPNPAFDK